MIPLGSDTALLTFLLFCRIGGCLMFMPGFSSTRIPVHVRLFVAISVTLVLAPLLLPALANDVAPFSPERGLYFLVSEVAIGVMIGMMGRMFFLALNFIGVALASFIGFSNLPGIAVEGAEPNPTLSALITMTATVLFFMSDLHWEVLRGLVASYRIMPVSEAYDAQFGLIQLADATSQAFTLAMQVAAPFLVYSVSINVLFGIVNKFTPQIAVYFVSLPFVMCGGLIILYFVIGDFMDVFMSAFGRWLVTG